MHVCERVRQRKSNLILTESPSWLWTRTACLSGKFSSELCCFGLGKNTEPSQGQTWESLWIGGSSKSKDCPGKQERAWLRRSKETGVDRAEGKGPVSRTWRRPEHVWRDDWSTRPHAEFYIFRYLFAHISSPSRAWSTDMDSLGGPYTCDLAVTGRNSPFILAEAFPGARDIHPICQGDH